MNRTIHDIIEEISSSVEQMVSSLDITGEVSKEEFQEMVFAESPSSIADLLFDLADHAILLQDCVAEIEAKIDPDLDFEEDLDGNISQTCDRCNKTLSRKETRS